MLAPGYLSSLCQPVSMVPGRRRLHSADRDVLDNRPRPLSICPRTRVERLSTTVLQIKTHFLSISEILVFL